MDDMSVHVGEPKIAAARAECQTLVVDPHEIKNRGMQIVHVGFIFDRPPTEFIGHTVHVASADATTCQKHREAEWMMASAVSVL